LQAQLQAQLPPLLRGEGCHGRLGIGPTPAVASVTGVRGTRGAGREARAIGIREPGRRTTGRQRRPRYLPLHPGPRLCAGPAVCPRPRLCPGPDLCPGPAFGSRASFRRPARRAIANLTRQAAFTFREQEQGLRMAAHFLALPLALLGIE
jgi:hypothetical protein